MPAALVAPRRASPRIATLALLLMVPVPADADTSAMIASKTIDPGSAQKLVVDFPVGKLEVIATDAQEITFSVELRCERSRDCEDLVEDVRAIHEVRDDEVRLRIEDSKWHKDHHLRGKIEVPRSMSVEVAMNVGELEIEGVEKDLEVRMSVGEVDVRVAENALKSVDVRVSIGDASMRPRGGSNVRGWLGKRIDWDRGTGSSRLDIDLSIGEANIRLL
jgi:hypothetical protein